MSLSIAENSDVLYSVPVEDAEHFSPESACYIPNVVTNYRARLPCNDSIMCRISSHDVLTYDAVMKPVVEFDFESDDDDVQFLAIGCDVLMSDKLMKMRFLMHRYEIETRQGIPFSVWMSG